MVLLQNIPQTIVEITFILFTTQKKVTDPMSFLSLIVTSTSFVYAVADIYMIYKEKQSNKRVKKAQTEPSQVQPNYGKLKENRESAIWSQIELASLAK